VEKRTPKGLIATAVVLAVFIAGFVLVGNFVLTHSDEREQFPAPLTREQFLEDFDYIIDTLESNFPYLALIYRRNGVDMLEPAEEIRERIADESFGIDHISFWDLLSRYFFQQAWPIGHLWLASYPEFQMFYELLGSYWNSPFNAEIMRHFRNRLRRFEPIGQHNFLSTRIIEEGHIAHLVVPAFSEQTLDRRRVDEFFSQLEGFGHLIIDLRDAPGGYPALFDMIIAGPLLDNYVQAQFHHFFMDGHHSIDLIRGRLGMQRVYDFDVESVSDIFPDVRLTPEVMEDLALMDFHFIETITAWPSGRGRAPFDGKIWMLVNEHLYSAAIQVATFYKEVGFATFVGEKGGGMPGFRARQTFFLLPNTGFTVRFDVNYFLDNTGRPLEYGFVPHYFNREGMDALETVLAMIEEGAY